jgi:hypothetical protein
MNHSSIATLNRLLKTLYRSLPMYLSAADPWFRHDDEQSKRVLTQIVADQERDCQRIASLILDRYSRVEQGEFPMEFTDLHFLSLDYLLGELIRHQHEDIVQIEQCIAWLQQDPAARSLAQEVLGSEKAHLEMLEELARRPSATA